MGATKHSLLALKNAVDAHGPKQAEWAFDSIVLFVPDARPTVPSSNPREMLLKNACG
jgi:hypothetical protein